MDLFAGIKKEPQNILPADGCVVYYGQLIKPRDSDQYYQSLLSQIEWRNDEAMIFGRHVTTKRKIAWYGEKPFTYTYSKITRTALQWTPLLLDLKQQVETALGETFNSCLLNLYHNGDEGMAWHSDGEKDLKRHGAIGSLTFGARRKFAFKHKKSGEKVDVFLDHGDLLVMKDQTQDFWLHRLPPTKTVHTPRINLTFRTIVETGSNVKESF